MTRTEEVAGTFATSRNLAVFCRRNNIPRFASRYQRRARCLWRQFAFALSDELGRELYRDEVDAMLFLHVGSGTP